VLPATLSEHLAPEEMDAVLLHELAHVLRWDNLTRAAVHALTCVFWFFPLLAWLERRIGAESELACDELVLICGARPQEYLSAILKVCRFYFLEPVAGSSNVSGSNLKRRTEYIVSSPISKASKVSAGVVSGLLFSCLAAALILTGFVTSTPSRAQSAEGSGATKAQVRCAFNGTQYAEGTVIQMGKASEQMCVQLHDRPFWLRPRIRRANAP
jgi:beta-lactamase regulating signal transducer with metallopeptidase domain